MNPQVRRLAPLSAWAAAFLFLLLALPAAAAPTFPPLTGRVVDNANVLSPAVEADLTTRLQALEDKTGRQLVVVTLPSLQGYEIEDYGYQLGRAWGIGSKAQNDGVLFIVAPNEKKVRIEVGYGLEGVLTDALSSVIIQQGVIPKFRSGDMEGGIVSGTGALIDQLALPDEEARQRVSQAAAQKPASGGGISIGQIMMILFVLFVLSSVFRRRRRGAAGWLAPIIFSGGGRSWGGGGGGWSSGGGGFSGGGGSFGGGGSSGSW